MRLRYLNAALALVLVAAVFGAASRHDGDTTPAQSAAGLAPAQGSAHAAVGNEAVPQPSPVRPDASDNAGGPPNQLAVLPEYRGLFPNEMAPLPPSAE
jgi:phage/plasmid primase-like uncharacterized protein